MARKWKPAGVNPNNWLAKKLSAVAHELVTATRTGDTQNIKKKSIINWFFLQDPGPEKSVIVDFCQASRV
jgi:hypothetical protein